MSNENVESTEAKLVRILLEHLEVNTKLLEVLTKAVLASRLRQTGAWDFGVEHDPHNGLIKSISAKPRRLKTG